MNNVSENNSSSQSNAIPAAGKPAKAGQSSTAGSVGSTVIAKAAEAEGPHRPPRMVRSMSASHIVPEESRITQQQEKVEVKKRDGVLWESKSRIPNRAGGYVYRYRLRDDFNDITGPNTSEHSKNLDEKMEEIFPASEPLVRRHLLYYMPHKPSEREGLIKERVAMALEELPDGERIAVSRDYSLKLRYMEALEDIERSHFKIGEDLQKLGYKLTHSDEGVFLEVPDRAALLANWENLRAQIPRLDKLDVVSSEGVAGDMEFVSAYLCHDALLSEGLEFIHDHFFHVIPALSLMLTSAKDVSASGAEGSTAYAKERYRLAKLAAKGYRTIMLNKRALEEAEAKGEGDAIPEQVRALKNRLKLVETALGAFVDSISANSNLSMLQRVTPEIMERYIKEYQAEPIKLEYLKKRHGEEAVKLDIGQSWEMLKVLEGMLDEARLSLAKAAPAQLSVAKEIENRQGELWECIGRTPHVVDGQLQGYVYKYRLRDEFNNVSGGAGSVSDLKERDNACFGAVNKIFPAVEPLVGELAPLYVPKDREPVPGWVKSKMEINPRNRAAIEERAMYELARKIGYVMREETVRGKKEIVLEVPDGVAVMARWDKLRKEEGLPESCVPIDIVSSEGIASDEEFLLAYFNHDVVLSNGREFIHDSFAHIIPTLRLISNSEGENKPIYRSASSKVKKYPAYREEKKRLVGLLRPYCNRIAEVRKALEAGTAKLSDEEVKLLKRQMDYFMYVLGSVADRVSANSRYAETEGIDEGFVAGTVKKGIDPSSAWDEKIKAKFSDIDRKKAWENFERVEKILKMSV